MEDHNFMMLLLYDCISVFTWTFLYMFYDCSFIQLDLGQLQVTNEFSWHGSPEKDPSAVHIDVLHAEVNISFFSLTS